MEVKIWSIIHSYLNVINHILIFAVSIYISFLSWYIGPTVGSLHNWLCTMGYQLLMAESILTISSTNSCTAMHSRRTKSHLHWILQLLGAILSMAGFGIHYANRPRHFYSAHSVFGIISLAFLCLTLLNGLLALWAIEIRSYMKPVYSKFFHNCIGIFTFVTGMVSLIFGYDTARMIGFSTPEIRVALQMAAGITLVLSVYMSCSALYGQFRSILSNRVRLPSKCKDSVSNRLELPSIPGNTFA